MLLKNIKSGIYKILNKSNGKFYIGSASYLADRKASHFGKLRKNIHPNSHLQRTWNNCWFPEEIFEFIVLEYCEKDKLLEREQYWIDITDACDIGYNMQPKARSVLGIKRSEETKKKMSEARKGKYPSKETRLKMSLSGKVRSLEHRQAVSLSMKRRKGKKYGPRKFDLILNGKQLEFKTEKF